MAQDDQTQGRSMKVRRISLPAFETAMAAARGDTVPEGAWDELSRAELASDGQLHPRWADALANEKGAKGHILPTREVSDRFRAALPQILAPTR